MTSPSDQPTMDLADHIRELTTRHTHREHYQILKGQTWYGQNHVTEVPALIHQLQRANLSSLGEERHNNGYASQPPARIDALDCLARIDLEASRWVRDLGEDDPSGTIACLRKLHSLVPSAHPVTRRDVTVDARRWWTQARICTGWDSPAWRPDNTCPLCGVKGLRVKFADKTALCVECGQTWLPETISLLAEHIRFENTPDTPTTQDA